MNPGRKIVGIRRRVADVPSGIRFESKESVVGSDGPDDDDHGTMLPHDYNVGFDLPRSRALAPPLRCRFVCISIIIVLLLLLFVVTVTIRFDSIRFNSIPFVNENKS